MWPHKLHKQRADMIRFASKNNRICYLHNLPLEQRKKYAGQILDNKVDESLRERDPRVHLSDHN
jgi:hypothetical protein